MIKNYYRTLAQVEHDICKISENSALFNGVNTGITKEAESSVQKLLDGFKRVVEDFKKSENFSEIVWKQLTSIDMPTIDIEEEAEGQEREEKQKIGRSRRRDGEDEFELEEDEEDEFSEEMYDEDGNEIWTPKTPTREERSGRRSSRGVSTRSRSKPSGDGWISRQEFRDVDYGNSVDEAETPAIISAASPKSTPVRTRSQVRQQQNSEWDEIDVEAEEEYENVDTELDGRPKTRQSSRLMNKRMGVTEENEEDTRRNNVVSSLVERSAHFPNLVFFSHVFHFWILFFAFVLPNIGKIIVLTNFLVLGPRHGVRSMFYF